MIYLSDHAGAARNLLRARQVFQQHAPASEVAGARFLTRERRRGGTLGFVQQINSGKRFTLQHRQACPAAGADVADFVGESKLIHCRGTVAAADNTDRITVGHRLCDSLGSFVEG